MSQNEPFEFASEQDLIKLDVSRVLRFLRGNISPLIGSGLVAAVLGYGASYLVKPTYLSNATILAPQQSQSSALANLGALSALTGGVGAGAGKNPGDQYVAYLQSRSVLDYVIGKNNLNVVYSVELMSDARKKLLERSSIYAGKKDGLIYIETEDEDKNRSAKIVADYVDGLQNLTSRLATEEAQQRRKFYEARMEDVKSKLVQAQIKLADAGFSNADIKTEPKAVAEEYAKLKAQIAATEIDLEGLKTARTSESPEVKARQAQLSALNSKMKAISSGRAEKADSGSKYISAFREFKYYEALMEIMAKQYETAKIDEGREGFSVQVIDRPVVAERKFKPFRSAYALGGCFVGFLLALSYLVRRAVMKPIGR